MRTVILRDDDTNALTPVECLEKLYRPFLMRGLPVNLAVIPEVRVDARQPDGRTEGFLPRRRPLGQTGTMPLAENAALTAYLRANPGFHLAQHGCHHDFFEFDSTDRAEVVRRLNLGRQRLQEAGFALPATFVAPHDKLSRVAFDEVARRYHVVSAGWFEWRRVPRSWWPRYLLKKLLGRPHWRIGGTRLLSHPGCMLSYTRNPHQILDEVKRSIASRKLTVLVTHWWEYFRLGEPDEKFIRALHQTADYLASDPQIKVISFSDLLSRRVARRIARTAAPFEANPAPAQ